MVYSENILICIAVPLVIAILFTAKGTRSFLFSFVMGMVTCLISAYISGFLRFVMNVETEEMAVFYSPLIEEALKLLPLLFYMFVFIPDSSKLYTAALGIGLGFATFENCCYILSSTSPGLGYVLIRGMAVGIMHLVCALFLAIGLDMAKRLRGVMVPGLFGALTLSAGFHGLYNLLVSEPGIPAIIGYLLPILNVAVLYYPYEKKIRNGLVY
ncbi:MAG: PrsW family intramembrane metalloprotease [Lachnospiraceae bacterium]|nr:PrsW family intramembrane metalloprotease [Lachnospiraceae bacterium]